MQGLTGLFVALANPSRGYSDTHAKQGKSLFGMCVTVYDSIASKNHLLNLPILKGSDEIRVLTPGKFPSIKPVKLVTF